MPPCRPISRLCRAGRAMSGAASTTSSCGSWASWRARIVDDSPDLQTAGRRPEPASGGLRRRRPDDDYRGGRTGVPELPGAAVLPDVGGQHWRAVPGRGHLRDERRARPTHHVGGGRSGGTGGGASPVAGLRGPHDLREEQPPSRGDFRGASCPTSGAGRYSCGATCSRCRGWTSTPH